MLPLFVGGRLRPQDNPAAAQGLAHLDEIGQRPRIHLSHDFAAVNPDGHLEDRG